MSHSVPNSTNGFGAFLQLLHQLGHCKGKSKVELDLRILPKTNYHMTKCRKKVIMNRKRLQILYFAY